MSMIIATRNNRTVYLRVLARDFQDFYTILIDNGWTINRIIK